MIASDANREGVIATFTFTEQPNHRWKVTRAQATPIWLSLKPTLRVVNLPQSSSTCRLSTAAGPSTSQPWTASPATSTPAAPKQPGCTSSDDGSRVGGD